MVYQSVDAFLDIIGPYIDCGINEFILAYPTKREQRLIFELIATEGISKLRA